MIDPIARNSSDDALAVMGAPSNTTGTPSEPSSTLTRRAWLGLSAAACGTALLLGSKPARALSIDFPDTKALRFLGELEALQENFFARAARSTAFKTMTGQQRDIISLIAEQDREHCEWYHLVHNKFGFPEFTRFYTPTASQSRPPREFMFAMDDFKEPNKLFALAQNIKELSLGAYHDLVGWTEDSDITEAIAALAGVEGRHAAILQEAVGGNALPNAFESAMDTIDVTKRLAIYGFKGEALQ